MKLKDEDGYVKDWVYAVSIFLAVVLLIGGILVGGLAGGNHSDHVACLRFSEQSGLATKTVGVVDVTCFVLVPGIGWVPADRYRGVVIPV